MAHYKKMSELRLTWAKMPIKQLRGILKATKAETDLIESLIKNKESYQDYLASKYDPRD